MDYKNKLDKAISEEIGKREAADHCVKSFEGQQRASFKKINQQLLEILEAAKTVDVTGSVGDSSAEFWIKESDNSYTRYAIEPNSLGKFSSNPSHKPGFVVEIESTPLIGDKLPKFLDFKTSEDLLDYMLKRIAEFAAYRQKKNGD
jgi:hypothetical protein